MVSFPVRTEARQCRRRACIIDAYCGWLLVGVCVSLVFHTGLECPRQAPQNEGSKEPQAVPLETGGQRTGYNAAT